MSFAKAAFCCSAEEDTLLPTSRGSGPLPSRLSQGKNWTIRFPNNGQKRFASSQVRILRTRFTIRLPCAEETLRSLRLRRDCKASTILLAKQEDQSDKNSLATAVFPSISSGLLEDGA